MAVKPKQIYCTNCARQIVHYNASTDRYVGKEGYHPIYDVSGFICHECYKSEQQFYELMEGDR